MKNLLRYAMYIFYISEIVIKARESCKNASIIRSAKADYYIIGLFPIYNTAPSRYNANALQYIEVVKYVLNEFNSKSPFTIGYVFYDTCGESHLHLTTEIVIDILIGQNAEEQRNSLESSKYSTLNSENELVSNGMCTCGNETLRYILGIVGAASSSVSAKTSHFLSYEQLLLVSYASTSPLLSDKKIYPNFIRTVPSDTYQVQVIIDLILHFNWNYISIIASDNSYGRSGTDELTKQFKLHNICVGIRLLFNVPYDNTDIGRAVNTIAMDDHAEVIVLFSLSEPSKMIFNHATTMRLYNRTWILTEGVGVKPWIKKVDANVISGAFAIIPYLGIYTEFEEYLWKLSYRDSRYNPYLKTFFNLKGIDHRNDSNITLNAFKTSFTVGKYVTVRNAITVFVVALRNFINDTCGKRNCTVPPSITNRTYFNEIYLKLVRFEGLLNETVSFDANGDIQMPFYMIKNMQRKDTLLHLKEVGSWNKKDRLIIDLNKIIWSTKEKPNSKCSDTCIPGFYALYVKSKTCCWDCIKCPKNQVKYGYGEDNNCTMCPESSVSDSNGSACIYIKFTSFTIKSVKGVILVCLSIFGVLSSLVILYTFKKFKKSTVLRSANLKLSVFQVVLQMMLFTSLMLIFLKTTRLTCSIQIYTIGCLLATILSIILIKTEVLLRIFKCKFRMSRSYARITTTLQLIIIGTISLTFIFIQFLLHLFNQPIRVDKLINYKNNTYTILCDFDVQLISIFNFLILLSLVCGLQAYRARKLPDVFNEGNFIMYAVFISSLNMVIILLLTQYGQEPEDKIFILFILVFTVNAFLMSIMYGFKVYIVWFKPNKKINTRTFRSTMRNLTVESRNENSSVITTDDYSC